MSFRGMAIGGPLDGHNIRSEGPSYTTYDSLPKRPAVLEDVPAEVKTFTYHFITGFRSIGGYEQDFFVPQGTTVEEVMKRLVERYRKYAGK